MSPYEAPIDDMRFAMNAVADLSEIATLPGCEQATPDLVDQVLDEAAKLARDVIAPLNEVGDRERSRLENGVVRTPQGFRDAYLRYVEGGWNALPFDPEHGGQGLPLVVSTAVFEMWNAANMGWALCPLLNVGAVELLQLHGTEAQKHLFVNKLIDGTWTGTMNLTEPQAGSDVGAVKTRAVRKGDHYLLTGQKIFITYGDHDFTENIIHLVLARTPDAPPGTKGISLFIVPKVLVNDDGALGARNDVRCVSLEHKLGIHASPTCVLAYGDNGGAIGYLVGEENRGMEYMFTMMNNARLHVGVQGVAIADRAYQHARAYARTRVQGRPITEVGGNGAAPIVHHPDVKRMLLDMRARTEATRALAYYASAALDRARRHPDANTRAREQRIADFLIPVVKAWCTDHGCEVASIGVQVHGGMGYIEETGAAQHFRDARIAPIYEGTNGIQANDLVGRKLQRDRGVTAQALLARMRETQQQLGATGDEHANAIAARLGEALAGFEEATRWLVMAEPARAAAAAVPYLRLCGTVIGGWLMGKAAAAALAGEHADPAFLKTKLLTARFYADHHLAVAPGILPAIIGGDTVLAFDPDQF